MVDLHPSVAVLWRLGDPFRDLRDEFFTADGPLVALTSGGTFRIVNWAERWHCRLPTSDHAVIAGDGHQLELEAITCATPCGLVVNGSLRESHSSSMPLVILCAAGDVDDHDLLAVIAAAQGVNRVKDLGTGHPLEDCGARYCEVNRP